MDIFKLTKSETRRKILALFLSDPDQTYYLHEISSKLFLSAGNIRRELISLVNLGLFIRIEIGRLVYYKINIESPLFNMIKSLSEPREKERVGNIVKCGFLWITKGSSIKIKEKVYCQTRDVFQVRLSSFTEYLEKYLGTDAYLIGAVAGEIGNNSFDHNLGNWPDIPGIYFAKDEESKTIVLADRGRGILATIRNVKPDTRDDKEALYTAFTKIISGRSPEQRGNGLKFVTKVLKNKKWAIIFESGRATLTIGVDGKMKIGRSNRNIHGCFAVIKY